MKTGLSAALLRLAPHQGRADLEDEVANAGSDAAVWAELAGDGVDEGSETLQDVLVDAVVLAVDGNYTDALRNVAIAAVMLEGAPEMDAVWSDIRDMVVNRANGGDTSGDFLPEGAVFAAIGMAGTKALQRKARALVALVQEKDPDFVERTWNEMLARVSEKPAGVFVPHLKALIHFDTIPKTMATRHALALTNELGKLPTEEVLAILTDMKNQPSWHEHRRRFKDMLVRQGTPDAETLQRPLVSKTSRDVFVSQPGPANVTMVIFCVTRGTPGVPVNVFDEHLAKRGIRAIYVCDMEDNAFLKGIKSIGGGRDGMVKHLRGLLDARPDDKVIMMGASRSLVMAVACAQMLEADGVMSLAGVISGDEAFRASIGDTRYPDLARQVVNLAGADSDMRTWLDRYPHRPVIHMHYAQSKRLDLGHAQAVEDYENVTLQDWPGHVEHSLTSEMILRGTFGQAIDQMLAAI